MFCVPGDARLAKPIKLWAGGGDSEVIAELEIEHGLHYAEAVFRRRREV